MGAKPGRMKGNEQEAEYEEPGERTWETRSEGTGKTKEAKAEGKHRWNSCGSEAGRDERKQTESRVQRTGKEDTGNQVGENGEEAGSESGRKAPEKPL